MISIWVSYLSIGLICFLIEVIAFWVFAIYLTVDREYATILSWLTPLSVNLFGNIKYTYQGDFKFWRALVPFWMFCSLINLSCQLVIFTILSDVANTFMAKILGMLVGSLAVVFLIRFSRRIKW